VPAMQLEEQTKAGKQPPTIHRATPPSWGTRTKGKLFPKHKYLDTHRPVEWV